MPTTSRGTQQRIRDYADRHQMPYNVARRAVESQDASGHRFERWGKYPLDDPNPSMMCAACREFDFSLRDDRTGLMQPCPKAGPVPCGTCGADGVPVHLDDRQHCTCGQAPPRTWVCDSCDRPADRDWSFNVWVRVNAEADLSGYNNRWNDFSPGTIHQMTLSGRGGRSVHLGSYSGIKMFLCPHQVTVLDEYGYYSGGHKSPWTDRPIGSILNPLVGTADPDPWPCHSCGKAALALEGVLMCPGAYDTIGEPPPGEHPAWIYRCTSCGTQHGAKQEAPEHLAQGAPPTIRRFEGRPQPLTSPEWAEGDTRLATDAEAAACGDLLRDYLTGTRRDLPAGDPRRRPRPRQPEPQPERPQVDYSKPEWVRTGAAGPRHPAPYTDEHDVNYVCGHHLGDKCLGCTVCWACDGCYCDELRDYDY
jgi:hypothetical protein